MRPSSVTHFRFRRWLPLLTVVLPVAILAAEKPGVPAVFRSTDHGRSWLRSDRGLPGDSRINAFGAVGGSRLAGTDAGVFRSRDAGQTWTPAAGLATNSGRVLSFATVGPQAFAAADRGGLLESVDAGATWTSVAGLRGPAVRCLLCQGERLYAGTEADGVMVSADQGQNWTRLQPGLPDRAQVFALAVVSGRLYAGLYAHGLHAWDGDSHRWIKTGPVLPLVLAAAGDTLVVGHNPGGLHWSADLGASWSRALPGPADLPDRGGPLSLAFPDPAGELAMNAPVWELASGGGRVFAGVADGIYYSEDSGRTWRRARAGLPAASPGVSFLVEENLVLAGTLIPGSSGP